MAEAVLTVRSTSPCAEAGVSGAALPKDLAADQWVTLFNRLE